MYRGKDIPREGCPREGRKHHNARVRLFHACGLEKGFAIEEPDLFETVGHLRDREALGDSHLNLVEYGIAGDYLLEHLLSAHGAGEQIIAGLKRGRQAAAAGVEGEHEVAANIAACLKTTSDLVEMLSRLDGEYVALFAEVFGHEEALVGVPAPIGRSSDYHERDENAQKSPEAAAAGCVVYLLFFVFCRAHQAFSKSEYSSLSAGRASKRREPGAPARVPKRPRSDPARLPLPPRR